MRTKKPKKGFMDGYKTYDTSNGFGDLNEWRAAWNERMGHREAAEALNKSDPLTVMGFDSMPTKSELDARYYKLAKIHHPDKGGDPKMFIKIQAAWSYRKGYNMSRVIYAVTELGYAIQLVGHGESDSAVVVGPHSSEPLPFPKLQQMAQQTAHDIALKYKAEKVEYDTELEKHITTNQELPSLSEAYHLLQANPDNDMRDKCLEAFEKGDYKSLREYIKELRARI